MGKRQAAFAQTMVDIVKRHAPDFDPASLEMRASREATYLSLTLHHPRRPRASNSMSSIASFATTRCHDGALRRGEGSVIGELAASAGSDARSEPEVARFPVPGSLTVRRMGVTEVH